MAKNDGDNASSRPVRKPTFKQELFAAEYVKTNGNGVAAARAAGYKGNAKQLAVQACVNRQNPTVQQTIAAMMESLQRPAVEQLAEALHADKQRCFVNKDGEIIYSEPEPDYATRLKAVKLVFEHRPAFCDTEAPTDNVQTGQQLTPAGSASDMDSVDPAASQEASETNLEKEPAALDHQQAQETSAGDQEQSHRVPAGETPASAQPVDSASDMDSADPAASQEGSEIEIEKEPGALDFQQAQETSAGDQEHSHQFPAGETPASAQPLAVDSDMDPADRLVFPVDSDSEKPSAALDRQAAQENEDHGPE